MDQKVKESGGGIGGLRSRLTLEKGSLQTQWLPYSWPILHLSGSACWMAGRLLQGVGPWCGAGRGPAHALNIFCALVFRKVPWRGIVMRG